MADINSKVFCTQCGYFNACRRKGCGNMQFDNENVHETCNAPQNIRPTYMSDGSDKYISTPSIINKYNNCKWFVAKGQSTDVHVLINKHNNDGNAHSKIQNDVATNSQRITELDQRTQYNINNHVDNFDNPHKVTKTQLGLGNVDNTSDLDKPISNAVQSALSAMDRKIEDSIGSGSIAITTLRNSISAEVSRAQQVEAAINSELSNEKQRAGLAEAQISGNVSTVAMNLTTETGRAQAAETALQSAVNTLNTTLSDTNQHLTNTDTVLSQEVIRAKQEEAELRSGISALSTTITSGDAQTLRDAKKYADDQDEVALQTADSTATRKLNDAIRNANSYSDGVASDAVSTAKAYSDARETAIRSDITTLSNTIRGEITDSATTIRSYIDGDFTATVASLIRAGDNLVKQECKRYTDETVVDMTDDIHNLHTGKADKATTLDGYGITDAYTKTEVDNKLDTKADSDNIYDKTYIDENVTAKINKLNGTESVSGSVINTVKTEINKLDVPASAITDEYVTDVVQVDGKISVTRSHISNNQVGTLTNDINSIKNRLDTIESVSDTTPGSIKKAIKDSKDYTDGQVSQHAADVDRSISGVNTKLEEHDSAIETINGNDTVDGSIKKSAKDTLAAAKSYCDTLSNGTVAGNTADIQRLNGDENTEGSVAKAIKDASDLLSEDISNHIMSVDAHTIDQITGLKANLEAKDSDINTINDTLITKADKATTLTGYGITDSYTKDKVYTKDETDEEIDNKVAEVNDKLPGYLPLTGNKTIEKNVKFNEGITVKTTADGDSSININGDVIKKTVVTGDTYQYELPNKNGTVSLVSDVNAAKAEVQSVTDALDTRITTLERSAIPSAITTEVKTTSLSTDKDVPSNYAVANALSLKANKQDTQDALNLKADADKVWDKTYINTQLSLKSDEASVQTRLAAKADITYVDSELSKKANANTTYSIAAVDAKLAEKANSGDVYTSEIVDNLLNNKADKSSLDAKANTSDVYTKTEVDDIAATKANKQEVDDDIALKADVSFVNTELAKKVDTVTLNNTVTAINDSIATKANESDVYKKTEVYTKTEVDNKIGTVYRPKGSVEDYAHLPTSGMQPGDVYNVLDTGANYVWIDTLGWDKLSETVDISSKQDIATAVTHQALTSVGNAGVPVYVDSNGSATPCSVDNAAGGTINSTSLINSGAVYAGMQTKANVADVYTKTEVYTKNEINTKVSDINNEIDNRYTKAQIDSKLSDKLNAGYSYSKQETDNLLLSKAVASEVYVKSETNGLLDLKADKATTYTKTEVDSELTKKADKATTYTKDEINATVSGLVSTSALTTALADKADKSTTYTKTEVNTALADKADKSTTYTKTEVDNAVNVKANSSDVYLKSEVTNLITGITRDYEAADRDNLDASKTYTDSKIKQIKDRHYIIETITDTNGDNKFYVKDFYSNNIDLTGRSGTILIYLPSVVTETSDGSREFLINIKGWDYENPVNKLGIRTIGGNATFRCGDLLDENNNIIMNKNEFSLRFQEYDNFAFLIDECGKGDTINNDKVQIDINQVTLNDGVNKYHIVIVDGQLSLDRIQE